MCDHTARVRKLVSGFNTLSEDDKMLVFEKMDILKQEENVVSKNQNLSDITTTEKSTKKSRETK